MNDYILVHHGVKGMRWGVRRSRSEITADRKRRSVSNLNSAKSIANDSAGAFRGMSNVAGTVANIRRPSKKVKKELGKMSDQELRAKINRMNMEQQYADLSPSRTARGASYAKSVLEVAGSLAMIGASSIGIAIGIKQLKG